MSFDFRNEHAKQLAPTKVEILRPGTLEPDQIVKVDNGARRIHVPLDTSIEALDIYISDSGKRGGSAVEVVPRVRGDNPTSEKKVDEEFEGTHGNL